MDFGIAGVAAITVLCYLAAQGIKATPIDSKWLPVICGGAGRRPGDPRDVFHAGLSGWGSDHGGSCRGSIRAGSHRSQSDLQAAFRRKTGRKQ